MQVGIARDGIGIGCSQAPGDNNNDDYEHHHENNLYGADNGTEKTSNNHNEQDDNEDDHSERDVDDQLTTITTFCSSWPANEKAQDAAWYMADRIVWSLLSLLGMHLAPLSLSLSLSYSVKLPNTHQQPLECFTQAKAASKNTR